MSEIDIKLKADVSKVVSMAESEVITSEEAKGLLDQFKKEDLIKELLADEIETEDYTDPDDEDDDEDEPETEPEKVKEVEEEPENEEIKGDDDMPVSDSEIDDLDLDTVLD